MDEPIIHRVSGTALQTTPHPDALLVRRQRAVSTDSSDGGPDVSPQDCDPPSHPFDLDECAGMRTQFFDQHSSTGGTPRAPDFLAADLFASFDRAESPQEGAAHPRRRAACDGASNADECAGTNLLNPDSLCTSVDSPNREGWQGEARRQQEEPDSCSPSACPGGAAGDAAAQKPQRRRRSSRRPMKISGTISGMAHKKMQRSPSSVSTASDSEAVQSAKRPEATSGDARGPRSHSHSKRSRPRGGDAGRARQPRRPAAAPGAAPAAAADDDDAPPALPAPRSPSPGGSPRIVAWSPAADGGPTSSASVGRLGAALRRVGTNESLRGGAALRRCTSNESCGGGTLLRRGTTNESLRSGGSAAGRRALALLNRATTNESLRSWATTSSAGGSSGRRGVISSEASTGTSVCSGDTGSDVGSPHPAADGAGGAGVSAARNAIRRLSSVVRGLSVGRSAGESGRLEDNAVIIFDWDDTLCPTFWGSDESGPETCVREDVLKHYGALLKHVSVVEAVLRAAREVAHVCIVTLANREWMNEAAHYLLPDLNIDAIFAELDVDVRHAAVSKNDRERGDHMAARVAAKKKAMLKCLSQFYRSKDGRPPWNVLSVGDSEIEQCAVKELLRESPGKTVCKTCKFDEDPSLEQLTAQLEALLPRLKRMAEHPKDVDWTSSGLYVLFSE